jgi:Tfp pilus assembly protein PilF
LDRLAQLEVFLKEDPDDPFNIYALALEYVKVDVRKARDLFDHLLTVHPNYLPTYYPYANVLIDLRQGDKAEHVFTQGIEIARRTDNQKTLKELTNAYNDWLFERT